MALRMATNCRQSWRGAARRGLCSFKTVAVVSVMIAACAGVATAASEQGAHVSVSRQIGVLPIGQLKAFARGQTTVEAAAERSPVIAAAITALTEAPPGVDPSDTAGQPNSDLRLLLTGLGSGRSVFAFTTTKGSYCLGLTGFTSGCLAGLPPTVHITADAGDPDLEGVGEPAIVWGFARNDVRKVSVIADGKT